MWPTPPPYYILFAHAPLSSANPGALSNTLRHPTVQYHYQDDPLLSLLPQHPDEHVLVLDYDPDSAAIPTVQSLSKTLVVTGLRIDEAPGAAAADEGDVKNDKMYTIETTEIEDPVISTPQNDKNSAHNALDKFKRRNALLRRALQYPNDSESSEFEHSTSQTTIPPPQ
ncbi:hypothetical protein JOM56_006218 [Amanita muscaria]|uniref:Uncharacterized protein n=1 Tax=Amanita muscaria (strain Koide BX008) TaxID=946122 RepID=A0A0C2T447_AMAMK|nr:hypothetical protein M378DRAFT_6602 [Amanita muscaria Koide BX008]